MEARLAAARRVLAAVDLFVAPSATIGEEYRRLGVPAARLRVSDNGTAPLGIGHGPLAGGAPGGWRRTPRADGPLRIGFVGTLVWHKGVHVLLAAARLLPAGSLTTLVCDPTVAPDYTARTAARCGGITVRFAGGFVQPRLRASTPSTVVVVRRGWRTLPVIHEPSRRGSCGRSRLGAVA